jgi:hypothetical protein
MLSREHLRRCLEVDMTSAIYNSHLEALDKLADLDGTLDRADEHTAGMLERLEAMEVENAALQVKVAELTDVCHESNAVCACGCPLGDHDRYDDGEACHDEAHDCVRCSVVVLELLQDLRARLADAERKAVERERAAFAVGYMHCYTPRADKVSGPMREEAERRYPLPPKDEGR